MMNKKLYKNILFYLCSLAPAFGNCASEALVIVHGTFSKNSSWFTSVGNFQEQIRESIKNTSRHVLCIPFTWSGEPHYKARLEAAEQLAKTIIGLRNYSKLRLVGHSHGANVINLASVLLELTLEDDATLQTKQKEIAKRIRKIAFEEHITGKTLLQGAKLDGCKGMLLKIMGLWNSGLQKTTTFLTAIQMEKLASLVTKTSWGIDSVQTILQMLQTEDIQRTYAQTKFIEEFISNAVVNLKKVLAENQVAKIVLMSKPLVDSAFLLACPVDDIAHYPSEKIIKTAYNLYSHGDLVQRVFGIYKRHFSQNNKNVINIPVTTRKTAQSKAEDYPGHNELHAPFIAHWLFEIPTIFADLPKNAEEPRAIEFYEDLSKPEIMEKD